MNSLNNSDNHFLKTLEIHDYKCFKNLYITTNLEFERVNLISGNNNIGKTALLESLLLFSFERQTHSDSSEVKHSERYLANVIYQILSNRKCFELTESEKLQNSPFPSYKLLKSFRDRTPSFYICSYEKHVRNLRPIFSLKMDSRSFEIFNANEYSVNFENLDIELFDLSFNAFFGTANGFERNLPTLINAAKKAFKIDSINKSINQFDSRFDEVDVIDKEVMLKNQKESKYESIHNVGAGYERYISMLAAIWAYSGQILFIDEIENGLHYSKYKMLWELIFKVSKEANCQVFATTHSLECIKAYNTVQMREDMSEASEGTAYYELFKEEDTGKIDIFKLDKDLLDYSLKSGKGIRGEQE